jgi:hypothetical protein
VIREIRALLERERPWIELFHQESYALLHGWMRNVKPLGMSFSTFKYQDVDAGLRTVRRAEWNRPVLWPLGVLAVIALAVVLPAVVAVLRRRRTTGVLGAPIVRGGQRA